MPSVSSAITIAASPAEVFDLSQDYAARLSWDPFLRSLRFLDGAAEAAVGVRFWVRARTGLAMSGRYVAFDRPVVVAIQMERGPWFFRSFAGSWRFRDAADGASPRTEAIFRYTFTTRPRMLSPVLDPLIGRVFERDIRARLAALKQAVEADGARDNARRPLAGSMSHGTNH